MKNIIFKSTALVLMATFGISSSHAEVDMSNLDSRSPLAKHLQIPRPVREFRGQKPWDAVGADLAAKLNIRKARKAAAIEPATSFSDLNSYDFLEGPDGSTWFYTTDYEYKTVEFEGGYTEKQIIAYTFTIYDSSFKEVGKIKDNVTFRENETRVASAVLDPAVTKKFFNYDENPEVMVYLAMNTGPELGYKVKYYNKVYSIGGNKEGDNDVPVAEVEGRCVDAFNAASDSWSESFFMTFVEDFDPDPDAEYEDFVDFVNAYKSHITVYKKAGWSGGPEPIFEYDINWVCIPGDTTDGIYFISKTHDGTPYFILSRYEKPYFIDPTGFAQDENATPDNSLLIEVYSYTSKINEVSTTKIPVEITHYEGQVDYAFYSIGAVAWKDDVDMSVNGTPSAPAFVVARDVTTAANLETVSSSYEIYGNDGKLVKTLAADAEGLSLLGGIAGAEPQVLFVTNNNDKYTFDFVNLYSGDKVLSLPQAVEGIEIDVVGDRVPAGNGKYKYAFNASYDERDGDNEIVPIVWFDTDGNLERVDRINAGPNVARAQVNMTRDVLNPYLYDTDPAMEYAVLVGRYTGKGGTVANEFIVVDDNGEHIITFSEADGKGLPYLFTVLFGGESNQLQMVYNDNYSYNIDIYELPFSMMAGGDGSEANPYQIASVADLQMIKTDPAAYYVIVDDIDGAAFEFTPISNFTGSLDGQSHEISNLNIGVKGMHNALFDSTRPGASVKNINFIDPVLYPSGASYSGLIAGMAMTLDVKNVHAFGLTAKSNDFDGYFGGLIGQASLQSNVTESSVVSADISLPRAEAIGGIVGNGRTGLSVAATSFSGTIEGAANIGGIIGESISGDETVADCHVDADITGENTLGGIIGSSKRSVITRTYVEGSLTAVSAKRPGINYSVGGLVGSLESFWAEEETPVIISDNIVALSKIDAPEHDSTMHRIIGASSINEDGGKPEQGLANNYALASLAPLESLIEAAAASTEGSSIEAIDREFLDETLGFKFGESAEQPWHQNSDSDPRLYFESSFIMTPSSLKVGKGETFNVVLRFLTKEEMTIDNVIGNFICEYDNTVIEMTGQVDMESNVLTIEFEALKTGVTDIDVNINGETATSSVEVVEAAGVDDVEVADRNVLTFDDTYLAALGTFIEVYTTAGVKVAAGNDSVYVGSLAKGIYLAVSTNSKGNRSILKIAL